MILVVSNLHNKEYVLGHGITELLLYILIHALKVSASQTPYLLLDTS